MYIFVIKYKISKIYEPRKNNIYVHRCIQIRPCQKHETTQVFEFIVNSKDIQLKSCFYLFKSVCKIEFFIKCIIFNAII